MLYWNWSSKLHIIMIKILARIINRKNEKILYLLEKLPIFFYFQHSFLWWNKLERSLQTILTNNFYNFQMYGSMLSFSTIPNHVVITVQNGMIICISIIILVFYLKYLVVWSINFIQTNFPSTSVVHFYFVTVCEIFLIFYTLRNK